MTSAHEQPIVARHTAIFDQLPRKVPSNRSVDGPLMGNGDVGVVIGGPPDEQVFYIGKNDFWSQYSTRPLPVGRVTIRVPAAAGAKYHQEQDLQKAEVRGKFVQDHLVLDLTLHVRSWTAASENLLVIELSSESPKPVAVEAELATLPGLEGFIEHYVDSTTMVADSQEMTTAYAVASGSDGELGWVTRKADPEGWEGREAAIATRVIGAPAVWSADGRSKAVASFKLLPGQPVTIASAILSNRDTERPLPTARQRVAELDLPALEELNQEHLEWWREFWSASFIDIADEQVEGYWYGALYILACCNRAGKITPGLWGNWVTTDLPMWHGDLHLNYNLQTPYYGVYSCNHPELAMPYYDPILAYVPKGREMARDLGCRGVHFPVAIGPEGMTVEEFDFGQRSDAVFCALNFISHYEYTQDKDFLQETIYPFLIEVADFWEDWLERDEKGRYVLLKSGVGEQPNRGVNTNPILDLALLRTLFRALLVASVDLGVDADRRPKWQDILDHLSDYPTAVLDGKRVFNVSEDWPAIRPGAWVIWPGGGVSLGSDPDLLETALNTISAVKRHGGEPQVYMRGVRVGHPDALAELKRTLTEDMFPNYYIEYGGGGIEMCGPLMAVNEMLLQSHEGFLRLFPVWPQDQPARFGRLRAVGAFLVSSELKDGQVQNLMIESEAGKDCTVLNPWPGKKPAVYELADGGKTPVGVEQVGDKFRFETRAGGKYVVQPAEA